MTQRRRAVTGGSTGKPAMIAAVTSILGVLTATFPDVPIWSAVTEIIPQLQTAIPVLLTAVGSIVAAFSNPPNRRSR